MKNELKKFAKGMFAIFTIKLLIFGTIFIIQSCTEEDNIPSLEVTNAKNSFLESLQKSRNNLSNAKIISSKEFYSSSSFNQKSINVTLTKVDLIKTDPTDEIEVGDFKEIIDLVDSGELIKHDNVLNDNCFNNNGEEMFLSVYVDESAVQQSMQPSLNDAKNYLYSKGLNNSDIQYLLESNADGVAVNESNLVPLVMAMIATEQNELANKSSIDFSSLFVTSAHAFELQENGLYDCAMRSLGIIALTEAFQKGISSTAGKKALKKAIVKVAGKTLGWVGAAWAAYEFGDCMGWW